MPMTPAIKLPANGWRNIFQTGLARIFDENVENAPVVHAPTINQAARKPATNSSSTTATNNEARIKTALDRLACRAEAAPQVAAFAGRPTSAAARWTALRLH